MKLIEFWSRICPELAIFPSYKEQKQAWKKAYNSSLKFWIILVVYIPSLLMYIFAGRKIEQVLNEYFGIPPFVCIAFFCVIFITAYVYFTILIPRHGIRMSLRKQLIESGIRVCMNCGYQLEGNTSGICPECGNPTAD